MFIYVLDVTMLHTLFFKTKYTIQFYALCHIILEPELKTSLTLVHDDDLLVVYVRRSKCRHPNKLASIGLVIILKVSTEIAHKLTLCCQKDKNLNLLRQNLDFQLKQCVIFKRLR